MVHRNDQLLIAAGAKTRSFKWFNRFGISNSYVTALNTNKTLADDHDAEVKAWKLQIETGGVVDEDDPEFQVISYCGFTIT